MRPDPEVLAVAWGKQDTALNALLAGRVATRLPSPFTSPFLRVFAVAGDNALAETSDIGEALLQWDAYAAGGTTPSPDYASASLVIRTLLSSMMASQGHNVAGIGYLVDFAPVAGPRRIEEPETGWARYSIDALVTVRP